MRFRVLPIAVAALFVIGLAAGVSAEDKQISFGVQADYGTESDFGVGARVRLDLGDMFEGLGVVGSFDYFFIDTEGVDVDATYWEISANGTYDLPMDASAVPYVGAGLLLQHGGVSVDVLGVNAGGSDNEVGLNILGGVKMDMGNMKLFVEARYEIVEGDQLVITAGVRF